MGKASERHAFASTPQRRRRRWLKWLVVVGLIVTLAGPPVQWWFIEARPALQRQAAALALMRETGLPASASELAEMVPVVPAEQNVATPFLAAAARLQPEFDGPLIGGLPALTALEPRMDLDEALAAAARSERKPDELLPDGQKWALIRRALERDGKAVAPLLAFATTAPMPADLQADFGVAWRQPHESLQHVNLSYLHGQRAVASLLRSAAWERAAHGPAATAWEHAEALLVQSDALAAAAWTPPELAVSYAYAIPTLLELAAALPPPVDPAERAVMSRLIERLLDESTSEQSLRQVVSGEAALQQDMVESVIRDSGSRLLRPFRAALAAREAVFMAEWMAASAPALEAKRLPEALAMLPSEQEGEARTIEQNLILSQLALTAFRRPLERHYHALAQRRVAAVALAIRLYQADHAGELPPSLEALMPAYLRDIPQDPTAADAPVRYDPERRILWTVGEDGEDNGGTTSTPDEPAKTKSATDVVLRLGEH